MARIFPDQILRSASHEVARVFRLVRKLPAHWHVWHNLTVPDSDAPDFLLVNEKKSPLLLKVSTGSFREARNAAQLSLLNREDETKPPGEFETVALSRFMEGLKTAGFPVRRVSQAIIFPNMGREDLDAVSISKEEWPNVQWLSKEWLIEKGHDDWAGLFRVKGLMDEHLALIRAKFSPECRIPKSFTAKRHSRNISASLDDYLLDYDQEYVLKTDLDLDMAGEQLSRDLRVQVVNGVAGSGKTLILLFRLKLLQSFFPKKRFLVLTHNRALIREMRDRYMLLAGRGAPSVKWHTFLGWCRSNWPDKHDWLEPISPITRRKRLKYSWDKHLNGTGISEGMLESEINWVKDSGFGTGREYLEADRRGRGFRLNETQRQRVSGAIYAYQRLLKENHEVDWWDIPRNILDWIRDGTVRPFAFDVVMVDEAQFFAGVWFDIIRRLVRPKTGYLFMAADPSQGFLRRGDSWKSVSGVDVRGRTHHLTRSYRTTQAILNFAAAFYRLRLPDHAYEFSRPTLESMPKGKMPMLLRFESPQDERARIVNEIRAGIQKNVKPHHILVLHASWKESMLLLEALREEVGNERVVDPREGTPGDCVRVTTINAGTGLECPVVFVSGLNTLFEKEGSLNIDGSDKHERVMAHTKKLYMAFTRAGQRLVMTYVGRLPPSLVELARRGFIEIEG